MSDVREVAAQAFDGFNDAEVVLVALALNSGARFRADIMETGLAEKMTDAAIDLVCVELRRREIDTNSYAGRLMERLMNALPRT
jgi:hypothetical protein